MALPPRGDPRRAMHLAARSMLVLGCLFLLLGTCVAVPALTGAFRGRGGPMMWSSVSGVAVFFLPGAAYVVASVFLGRRQFWAVVIGLVLASAHALLVVLGVLGMVVGLASTGGRAPMPLLVFLLIWGLLLLALGQLIYHLSRSFEAIKLPPYGQEVRGFEPLPVAQPVVQPLDRVIGSAQGGAPQPPPDPADTEEANRADPSHGTPPYR
jgi:hypothetical protein